MDFVKMVLPSRRNTNFWLFGGSKDQRHQPFSISILKAKVDPPKASKMAPKMVKFHLEIDQILIKKRCLFYVKFKGKTSYVLSLGQNRFKGRT